LTDAITPEKALGVFQRRQAGKEDRIAEMLESGYPTY
jgi:hypothetical protein